LVLIPGLTELKCAVTCSKPHDAPQLSHQYMKSVARGVLDLGPIFAGHRCQRGLTVRRTQATSRPHAREGRQRRIKLGDRPRLRPNCAATLRCRVAGMARIRISLHVCGRYSEDGASTSVRIRHWNCRSSVLATASVNGCNWPIVANRCAIGESVARVAAHDPKQSHALRARRSAFRAFPVIHFRSHRWLRPQPGVGDASTYDRWLRGDRWKSTSRARPALFRWRNFGEMLTGAACNVAPRCSRKKEDVDPRLHEGDRHACLQAFKVAFARLTHLQGRVPLHL